MSVFTIVLYILLGCLVIGVSFGFLTFLTAALYKVIIFIISTVLAIPYWFYLAGYIESNNLPKSFRKRSDPKDTLKDAAHFYNDILHFRKPTFD